jgi:hypothetical protein
MPLFGRGRLSSTPDAVPSVPGLADAATAQGWQPVSGNPFDGHLEDAVHDISRAMYGAPRKRPEVALPSRPGCRPRSATSIS